MGLVTTIRKTISSYQLVSSDSGLGPLLSFLDDLAYARNLTHRLGISFCSARNVAMPKSAFPAFLYFNVVTGLNPFYAPIIRPYARHPRSWLSCHNAIANPSAIEGE
ncbi:uncharacterized protein BT62DRAFT_1007703 [Guyanagaster necrorhizus]|uniref:Uncharacterized protein n=1 Tax=Guyanagaster necrorhizus TaxID=856835 RepID=A0A9P7VRJ8_9AGAR|nr:uncharacterized protein BT62DRAFT_1007703 [Guyanagaster necrorhizus MCA 3950]KAG7444671.1 hypothetical protein BT62DRAFT_1007703 [Guyanagaster necrorhizus MCA 3950]